MDRIYPTQPTSCTFAQYSQQASSSTNNIQGSVYVRIMVFTRQIQNRITFSLVAATDNLLGCWMHYARFGGPQSRERRIESKMIWAQYPTVPSLFAAPDRRRKDASAGGGGGGGGAAAGSIQQAAAAAEAKGEKGSERASEQQSLCNRMWM